MNINLMWFTLSNPTYACESRQNRRQIVFNRGVYVGEEVLDILKTDKNCTDSVFYISIEGNLDG